MSNLRDLRDKLALIYIKDHFARRSSPSGSIIQVREYFSSDSFTHNTLGGEAYDFADRIIAERDRAEKESKTFDQQLRKLCYEAFRLIPNLQPDQYLHLLKSISRGTYPSLAEIQKIAKDADS